MITNDLYVQIRSTVSDFAVFLTILVMVLLDYLVGVPSPKLSVPERFEVKLLLLTSLGVSMLSLKSVAPTVHL